MYLIVYRCMLDDIPVGLFATKDEAMGFALGLPRHPTQNIFDSGGCDPINITIVEFGSIAEPGGSAPIRSDVVKVLTEQEYV